MSGLTHIIKASVLKLKEVINAETEDIEEGKEKAREIAIEYAIELLRAR